MKWNWQQAGWPHFTYDEEALAEYYVQLMRQSGMQFGAVKHLR